MELPLAGVPRRRAVGAAYRRAPNHRHSLAPRGRKQSRLRRQARTGTEAADTNHRRTQWQAGTGTGTVPTLGRRVRALFPNAGSTLRTGGTPSNVA